MSEHPYGHTTSGQPIADADVRRLAEEAERGYDVDAVVARRKHVAVTVAEERELLSPQQVADRLGFSRQHVVRLINAGRLEAQKLPGSSYWQIPLATVLAFEDRRERGRQQADAFSWSLDALGAPLE